MIGTDEEARFDLLWEDAMIAILGVEVLPTNFRSSMAFLIREIVASRFRELEPGNAAPSFPISSRTPPSSEGFCLFLDIAAAAKRSNGPTEVLLNRVPVVTDHARLQ